MTKDRCDITVIHEDLVDSVMDRLPSETTTEQTAYLFKLFADPTRLRILEALRLSELCVCDLSAVLDMSQSAVSHQLRTLRQGRLVRTRREGKVVYYALDDEHVSSIIDQGLEHIAHTEG